MILCCSFYFFFHCCECYRPSEFIILFAFALHSKSMVIHIWHRSYTPHVSVKLHLLEKNPFFFLHFKMGELNVPCDTQSPISSSQSNKQQSTRRNGNAPCCVVNARFSSYFFFALYFTIWWSMSIFFSPCARFRSGTFLSFADLFLFQFASYTFSYSATCFVHIFTNVFEFSCLTNR